MDQLSADLGCIDLIRVDMATTQWSNGLLFINGDVNADGLCWSALGMASGFAGSSKKTVTEFGAPPGWQIVSLSQGCGIQSRATVHHEVDSRIITVIHVHVW